MPVEASVASAPLLICVRCRATGLNGWKKCLLCRGMALGSQRRGRFLFWGWPLTRYHLSLARAQRVFNRIRLAAVLIVILNFFIWFGVVAYRTNLDQDRTVLSNPYALFQNLSPRARALFWLGLGAASYAWYRRLREREQKAPVEHHAYGGQEAPEAAAGPGEWNQVRRLPSRARLNIADAFTSEGRETIARAYALADRSKASLVTPLHLLIALLKNNRIGNIFIRLGIPVSEVLKPLASALTPSDTSAGRRHGESPTVSAGLYQVFFAAYERAYAEHQEYVSVTELLEATVEASPALQELLFDLNIEKHKLLNVITWARVRERLHRQYRQFRTVARHRSKHGMDRAMTAVATPYLNQFSDDVTLLAQFGHTEVCVAREREIEEIFQVVEGGSQNVLLVGDYGVGKRSIIEGIAERMVGGDVPERLRDKRLVRLSTAALLAGATPAGAVERLMHIMAEIARARNIILFIHNIHELVGVSAGAEGGKSLDVAGTLAQYIGGGRFLTLATTTTEAYAQTIASSALGTAFTKVEIAEMTEDQAVQVLESKVGMVEYGQQVFFSYAAIEKAVQLAKRFVHEIYLPGNALEVMREAGSYTHNKKGAHTLVTAEEVAVVVAEKTKIPVTTVSADETTKLLHLEEAMHQRVVGQDEAVGLVANALRRARVEIRSANRPIANFLFLGPTGVGKTELAKTIAAVYFGGEKRMIRLDMSEYQDKGSIYRLLGAPGEKGTGILTEAVRRDPFALVLLDEIEKADKDVLNVFLQVMDDGRLTDSSGRVVDFTNVILIATSNAGTAYVAGQLRQGVPTDAIKDRLLHGELAEYFRPEFLNRFDGIVLFKPLSQADLKQVASLMLKRIGQDLAAKGITLQITDGALDFLASVGFDPDFGARPMRRALQERVENKLAELLLGGQLKRRDTVLVGDDGAVTVTH